MNDIIVQNTQHNRCQGTQIGCVFFLSLLHIHRMIIEVSNRSIVVTAR